MAPDATPTATSRATPAVVTGRAVRAPREAARSALGRTVTDMTVQKRGPTGLIPTAATWGRRPPLCPPCRVPLGQGLRSAPADEPEPDLLDPLGHLLR